MLDIILIVISALCMIAGLAGCILPFLPGPPIAYLGLVILHFTDKVEYTTTQLIGKLGMYYRNASRTSFLTLGYYSRAFPRSCDW